MEHDWSQWIEALLGIAVGASCTAMVLMNPPPSSAGSHNVNGVITRPTHVCLEPAAMHGTRLDGDAMRQAGSGALLCNGFTGKWESAAQRAKRLSELRSPNKGWRGG